MKYLIYIFAGVICFLVTLPQVEASPLENKKQRFRITVLNTGGEPQQGIILKVAGYSSEYISDKQGLIDFEQSTENNYIRTANFYLPTDKNKTIKSLQLDEAAQDTIIRIDRPEDLARFKQNGKTLRVNGVLKEGDKAIPHAEISIQGTGKRTFSNTQGEFSIEADYSHLIMIRAESMENKYLDIESFLKNPNQPLEIRMTKKGSDRIYHVVEKMPEYPGGMKAFFNYIRRKAHTTELAEKTQKEGAVMVQFIVEKDGSITSPSIVRGLDARLDTAALDAIIVMPDWIPAQEHGVNVRCKYSVPIPFKKPKPAPPVTPQPTPDIKKDSLTAPSVPADSLIRDRALQVIAMPSADSLTTDTLSTDTTLVLSADSTILQKETVSPLPASKSTEVKPKKRNIFVRFFHWLFGIKDKENTPTEFKEEKTTEIVSQKEKQM